MTNNTVLVILACIGFVFCVAFCVVARRSDDAADKYDLNNIYRGDDNENY